MGDIGTKNTKEQALRSKLKKGESLFGNGRKLKINSLTYTYGYYLSLYSFMCICVCVFVYFYKGNISKIVYMPRLEVRGENIAN